MLLLFYVILISIYVFNPHGKGKGIVSNIVRTSFKITFWFMTIILVIHFLLKAGVIH